MVPPNVDPLRKLDVDEMGRATPSEKAGQTLDAMATGIKLKRVALRTRHPTASEAEVDALMDAWLAHSDE